jgi:hypothetical protein
MIFHLPKLYVVGPDGKMPMNGTYVMNRKEMVVCGVFKWKHPFLPKYHELFTWAWIKHFFPIENWELNNS